MTGKEGKDFLVLFSAEGAGFVGWNGNQAGITIETDGDRISDICNLFLGVVLGVVTLTKLLCGGIFGCGNVWLLSSSESYRLEGCSEGGAEFNGVGKGGERDDSCRRSFREEAGIDLSEG